MWGMSELSNAREGLALRVVGVLDAVGAIVGACVGESTTVGEGGMGVSVTVDEDGMDVTATVGVGAWDTTSGSHWPRVK